MLYLCCRILSAKGADNMGNINNPIQFGQMVLTDRVAIEVGLAKDDSFKKIAKIIGRHPVTVAREIKENRTKLQAAFPCGNDCKHFTNCHKRQMCGADIEACNKDCKRCRGFNCRENCDDYESAECLKTEKPPYVCNTCSYRRQCKKTRYYYNARYADAAVKRRRSDSRSGPQCNEEDIEFINQILKPLVNKGQPLTHIYAEHENEFPVSLRTLYNYIDAGRLKVKNIDLRRKTGYKPRKKDVAPSLGFQNQEYRQMRTYDDYTRALGITFGEHEVVEMDTVKGVREKGKRLLTMIFRKNSIMLLFLLPDGTADSVKMVFDYLELGLGYDTFRRLFPVILTDNGSEFKRVDDLELNEDFIFRTSLFYCDPMASWQKPHIEKNHEYIRYVIPKGKSFTPYQQEDITLLMNHINSTKRASLKGKAPYELIDDDDEDMKALMDLLKMHLIPADEVHLTPDLFK